MVKNFIKRFLGSKPPARPARQATVVPRAEHNISRADISDNALRVLKRITKAGFEAYLVGGSVRDLLLRHTPKDFDVVTSATPEQVRKIFRNCRLIGRRFRLAHIYFGREIIEVATYRTGPHEASQHHARSEQGMIIRDNVFGNIEEDAFRRDFTINALFYDLKDFSVVDYTGGFDDIKQGIVRIIGDANERYREDPIRILRAIRFAAKLGFSIHPDTEKPIKKLAPQLKHVPPSRMFEEVLKLLLKGSAANTFNLLHQYELLAHLFPDLAHTINEHATAKQFVQLACNNTDYRIEHGQPVTPGFLFAVLLWPSIEALAQKYCDQKMSPYVAHDRAIREVMQTQQAVVCISRRYTIMMKEIWRLQPRFDKRFGKKPMSLLHHPRFRAAYDFLLLRCEVGEMPKELGEWWTRFQEVNTDEKFAMIDQLKPSKHNQR